MVHIGKKIEEVFNKSGMKLAHFAKALNTVPRNIYLIFQKDDLKMSQLEKISQILNHDFLQYYVKKEDSETMTQNKEGVHLTFFLDGSEDTLQKAFNILKAVNEVIKK
jgi:hypothetical protein